MRRIILGLSLLAACGAVASAQPRDSVQRLVGTEVRFRMIGWRDQHTDLGWMDGRVIGLAPDTVRVRICTECRYPVRDLAPIHDFEIQRHVGLGPSRGSNSGRGALVGALAGVLYTGYKASSCPPPAELCGLEWILAPVFAAGGAGIGALVGAIVDPGRWEAWPPHD